MNYDNVAPEGRKSAQDLLGIYVLTQNFLLHEKKKEEEEIL